MQKRTLIAILSMTFLATFTFAQFPGMPPIGIVKIDSLKSEVLKVNRNYSVYLPKSYTIQTTRQYPVLYLLHGIFDNNNGWVMRGHLQDVANQIMLMLPYVMTIIALIFASNKAEFPSAYTLPYSRMER